MVVGLLNKSIEVSLLRFKSYSGLDLYYNCIAIELLCITIVLQLNYLYILAPVQRVTTTLDTVQQENYTKFSF